MQVPVHVRGENRGKPVHVRVLHVLTCIHLCMFAKERTGSYTGTAVLVQVKVLPGTVRHAV